ncbi:uncharacterized protein PG998_014883 [Apiospora kogelbergensis]|uniref:uncharacterized protein n=1 Tax=Apiospora kogelbergensis TaxID=1337665 RepID=UPI003131239C
MTTTRTEWAFIAIVAAQAVSITAVQAGLLAEYLQWINPVAYQAPTSYVIPITFAVAALGCWFQVLVAVDSCRIKNKLQIWIQCIVNVCLSITLALQFSQAKEANDSLVEAYDMFNTPFTKNPDGFWRLAHPISILCIAISAVCSVGLCTTATRLHAEFSWSVYEHISSDALIKKRHDQYQNPAYRTSLFKAAQVSIVVYLSSRMYLLCNGSIITAMKTEMIFFASLGTIFTSMSFISAIICISNFGQGLKALLSDTGSQKINSGAMELDRQYNQTQHVDLPQHLRLSRRFDIE